MLGIETGPDWGAWVGYVVGILGGVGSAIAAGWAWYTKQRQKEEDRVGKPYKKLFEEVKSELKLLQDGMKLIQTEYLECKIESARAGERNTFLEAENAMLKAQLREARGGA